MKDYNPETVKVDLLALSVLAVILAIKIYTGAGA